MKKRKTFGNKSFYAVEALILIFALLIVAIPLLNVVASSFSGSSAVVRGQVGLWPVGFNLNAYRQIFRSSQLLQGTFNSILYTTLGTIINIVMTVLVAYPLSVKDFEGRGVFMAMFMVVMVFSAPLIPKYLVNRQFGLIDSMWALIIPNALSVYNMIIARTYFSNSIPKEMSEAARIDGASDIRILTSLVLPLSKSVLAVLVLYYAVSHWNTYFDAFIYINSSEKFPLQVVLRNIISSASSLGELSDLTADQSNRLAVLETLKYAVIVYGCIPVALLYPLVQRYFVKGVMVGSVKG